MTTELSREHGSASITGMTLAEKKSSRDCDGVKLSGYGVSEKQNAGLKHCDTEIEHALTFTSALTPF